MKKRKIGIVSEYYYPHLGGITEHVYYLSRELLRRGFEVVLLTGNQGEIEGKALLPSLRIIRFGKTVPVLSNESFAKVTLGWRLGAQIKKVIEDEKFDLIHIHSPLTPVLPLLFEKYSNTVTVGTIHTYFDSAFLYGVFRKVMQNFLIKFDGLIAVSASCITAMDRYFKMNYQIIPNGVDTQWFRDPTHKIKKYDDGVFNIFFLGRLDPRNGLDTLLDAMPFVLQKHPKSRLIIAGDGPLREFYEKKAGPRLNQSIFFEGQINSERPMYFSTSHVFCYPATKASFGITLLESMAAGTPVVATDNRGFRDIIDHGRNGLLTPPEDPEKLAETLIRIQNDTSLAKHLSVTGRIAAERYNWAHVTDQILEFYNKVYLKKKGQSFAS